MKIRELFNEVTALPGSNAKKELLKNHMNDDIMQIFIDTYDTSKKYHIKKLPPIEKSGELTLDNDYVIFHNLLELLNSREITGNTALMTTKNTIEDFTSEDQIWLVRILDRNLKFGVSLDNFNSISDNKISKFSVALANKIQDAKNIDLFDGTWFVSRKLDGCRCIAIYDGQDVKFYSRQGKEFKTLSKIKLDIENLLFEIVHKHETGTWVLDGEICMLDKNGNEHFNKIMKEITRKDHTIEMPFYKVFDVLTLEEFNGERISPNFSQRYEFEKKLFKGKEFFHIGCVKQERITDHSVYDKWLENSKTGNWEGLMVRKDVPYEGRRSNNLLKIKEMQDAEYVVKDVITGTFAHNDYGTKILDVVSALVIEHKGNLVKVGSGLSLNQRLKWYSNPEDIIGKTITVQYFEETRDSKTGELSLRFPTLKHVYENGREA